MVCMVLVWCIVAVFVVVLVDLVFCASVCLVGDECV